MKILAFGLVLLVAACSPLPGDEAGILKWFDDHRPKLRELAKLGEANQTMRYPLNEDDSSTAWERARELAGELGLSALYFMRTPEEKQLVGMVVGYFAQGDLKRSIHYVAHAEGLPQPGEDSLFEYRPLGETAMGQLGWYLSTPLF